MAVVYNKDKYDNKLTTDEMLKRFKRKVAQEGIMLDLKKHECFVPNAVKRREKAAAHARVMRKMHK